MNDRLLNAHQVADMLGLRNYRSVYPRMANAGITENRVPGIRGVRWYESEVVAWMRRNDIRPGEAATGAKPGAVKPTRWGAA